MKLFAWLKKLGKHQSTPPAPPQLLWFDDYSNQSTAELIALEGKYRTDSLVSAFEIALENKTKRVGKESLSEAEETILAVEALQREVNNGGYSQFFFNSSRFYAPVIVQALQRIGCTTVVEITQTAIDVLGDIDLNNDDAIQEFIVNDDETIEDQFDACDTLYYRTAGDLSVPLFEYIKENQDHIVL